MVVLFFATCVASPCGAIAQQPSPSTPVSIDLTQALSRAEANEPAFAASTAASRVAGIDRSIAQAALLPSATYHNQYLYTQPNGGKNQAGSTGSQAAPRFITNNAVHEYASQVVVNETIGLQQWTAVSSASAAAAIASAELEIARRGLVATVVNLFYGSLTANRKLVVAERATTEAASFTTLTQQREAAREGAHADVVKAQLQQQQRDLELIDAQLQADRSRLELAILLFPDPRTPYTLTVSYSDPAPLATKTQIEAEATHKNPELESAIASLRASSLAITSARAAYLPDLGLNFTYGVDAEQLATRGPEGVHNLGYSASATLDIPLWNWLSTQHRVRQAQILRDATKVALSATQRRLVAQLDESYAEASAAHDQLQSLDLSVSTATESLHLTRLRYTSGEATVLEIVDAQNSLTTAELAREDGVLRYQTALANLQILTGTL
ncbi:TolC family protein [Granulicella arctica]|uniref:Outer membrane protein TolC n=1 Tax=Granulicella arctica TaxID=940613 RepID=A0A7Y9PII0_9BACT|nr:TolC family protein [Granulicella arctica]NYF80476.1 outer membrane protein TolC [Granulicella arctica]